MAIEQTKIDVLKVILDSDKAINSNEIAKKIGIEPRTIQRAIVDLKKTNRVAETGRASATVYFKKDFIEAYQRDYKFIFVHKKDTLAGVLFFNKDGFVFMYDSEYLIARHEPIPTLPLQLEGFSFGEIPPVFEDNIPEGINRDILKLKVGSDNEIDMLPRLSNNIGDISFSHTKATVNSDIHSSGKSPSYLTNMTSILGQNIFVSDIGDYKLDIDRDGLFPEGEDLSKYKKNELSGISGFQYKLLVNIDHENKQISDNKASAQVMTHILKPYSKIKADENSDYYLPHLALNEHLFMSFAKNALGLRVPASHVFKTEQDKEYHYAVKRFDRLDRYKYSKISFATFLGLISERKYETTSEKMFKRIVKELYAKEEKKMLLKYYFYSMLIGHEDMHSKNLSLMFDGAIRIMAPLYDVACTRIYQNIKGYDSHLTINGKNNNIRPNDFMKLAEILGVAKQEILPELKDMALLYKDKLPSYVAELSAIKLPFYLKKQRTKVGGDVELVIYKETSFQERLMDIYELKLKELQETGWLS